MYRSALHKWYPLAWFYFIFPPHLCGGPCMSHNWEETIQKKQNVEQTFYNTWSSKYNWRLIHAVQPSNVKGEYQMEPI